MSGFPTRAARPSRGLFALPIGTFAGFAAAFVAAVVVAFVSWRSLADRAVAADRVSHSLEVIAQAQLLLSTIKDAETGQRGYLLTGAERYLEPYTTARARLAANMQRLRELSGTTPREVQRLEALGALGTDKMTELAETIRLRRDGKTEAALATVESDRGKIAMDRIRTTIEAIVRDENATLEARQTEWQDTVRSSALVTVGGSLLLIALIVAAAAAASRDYRAQQRQEWLRSGQIGLARAIAGESRVDVQAEGVLAFLAEYLQAMVGAFYVTDAAGGLRRSATYALAAAKTDDPASSGDNLLAQAVKDRRALRIEDVPGGYLPIASATGGAPSRAVLIAPAVVDGAVQGVVELGFLRAVDATDEALLERVAEQLGIALRTARNPQRGYSKCA